MLPVAGIPDLKAKQKALRSFDKDLAKMAKVGDKKIV